MQTVSIIRNRGQLTIPDSVRKIVNWITPMSAVTISVIKPDEIVIKPHQKYVNWEKVWVNINKSRAIIGKGKLSAAAMLEYDRKAH